ncbi:MAG: tape measure protein [Hyphomicrobium sp.]|uniref:tape measure protein n=1 Tax=Hyphomicrobium sp. TaxID=82 RepID=UPI003D12C6DF
MADPTIRIRLPTDSAKSDADRIRAELRAIAREAQQTQAAINQAARGATGGGAGGARQAAADAQAQGRAASAAAQSAAVFERAILRQERAMVSAQEAGRNLAASIGRLNLEEAQAAALNQRVASAVAQFTQAMQSGALTARQMADAQGTLRTQLGQIRREVGDLRFTQARQETAAFRTEMQNLGSAAVLALGPLSGVGSRVLALGSIMSRGRLGVGLIGAAFVAAAASVGTVQDRFVQYEARLTAILGTQRAARESIDALAQSAIRQGTSLDASIDAFARFSLIKDALGATNSQMIQLTTLVGQLGVISGASQQEISGAILQLSQGLAVGNLAGQDLKALMQNLPALAVELAKGLDVNVGRLREMGAAGELASDRVFGGLLSRSEEVNRRFEAMPGTIERSMQSAKDSVAKLVAEIGKAVGASQMLQAWFDAITRTAERMGGSLAPLGAADRLTRAQQELSVLRGESDISTVPNIHDTRGILLRREIGDAEAVAAKLREIQALKTEVLTGDLGAIFAGISEQQGIREASIGRGLGVLAELDDQERKLSKLRSQQDQVTKAQDALRQSYNVGLIAAQEYTTQSEQLAKAMALIHDEMAKVGAGGLSDEAKTAADAIRDMVRGVDAARERIAAIGGGDLIEVEALQKARDILRDVADSEAPALARALGLAATSAEELAAQVADVAAEAIRTEALERVMRDFAAQAEKARFEVELFRAGVTGSEADLARGLFNAGAVRSFSQYLTDARDGAQALARTLDDAGRAQALAKTIEAARTPLEQFDTTMKSLAEQRAFAEQTLQGERLADALRAIETAGRAARSELDGIGAADLRTVIDQTRTPAENLSAEMERLGKLRSLALETQTGSELATSLDAIGRAAGEAQGRFARLQADPILRPLESGLDRVTQAITEMSIKGGDAFVSLRDIAIGVAAEIQQAFLRLAVINPILNSVFGLKGSSAFPTAGFDFGNLFGGGGGGPLANAPLPSFAPTPSFHGGGIVGVDQVASRVVSLDAFRNAQRFHSGRKPPGVGPNEVPAILHTDEGVFTPAQMKAMGGDSFNFAIEVNAPGASPGTAAEIEERLRRSLVPALKAEIVPTVLNAQRRMGNRFK